jgi:hypothetical protein
MEHNMDFRKKSRKRFSHKKHANLGHGKVGRMASLLGPGKKPVRTKGKTRTL